MANNRQDRAAQARVVEAPANLFPACFYVFEDRRRRRIERLFPGPYLKLYARTTVPGWTAWGNEIQRDRWLHEAAE